MKVELEYDDYSHSDWERIKEEFKKYTESLYDKYVWRRSYANLYLTARSWINGTL